MLSDLQSVFNSILAGKTIKIPVVNKRRFESIRTSLLRKFSAYGKMVESIGADNPFAEFYLRASWDGTEVCGVFSLAPKTSRQNSPAQQFEVVEL
jgi:hypothetical protein